MRFRNMLSSFPRLSLKCLNYRWTERRWDASAGEKIAFKLFLILAFSHVVKEIVFESGKDLVHGFGSSCRAQTLPRRNISKGETGALLVICCGVGLRCVCAVRLWVALESGLKANEKDRNEIYLYKLWPESLKFSQTLWRAGATELFISIINGTT